VTDVPEEPKIQYVRCSGRQATVRWVQTTPGKLSTPITNYRIEMNSTFDPDTWRTVKEVAGGSYSTLVQLAPWGNYSFRIVAENKVGTSFPSQPSTRACSSPADSPNVVPGNVTIGGDKPGELSIKWTVSVLSPLTAFETVFLKMGERLCFHL
jgi:receptor-type tyrosine-protein phosphatase zeta